MHLNSSACLVLALFTGSGLAALPAHAQVTFVTSQAALGGNDSINWQSYGFTENSFPSGKNLLTASGASFNITDPLEGVGSGIIFDPRGPIEIGDPTDFTAAQSAQALRIPYSNPFAEISINFSTPVSAVGALLENRNANHSIGPTFTGFVSAYNGTALLGTFSETNTIQNLKDGSAPFLGVLSSTADITSVVYSVTQNNEFYIGPVSLNLTPAPSVPEASTTASFGLLLALGLGGLTVTARRKRADVKASPVL